MIKMTFDPIAKSTPSLDPTPWLSVKQIAEEFQVTERTVWRWIKEGHLKIHRFGRTVRISPEDRLRFIEKGSK